MNKIRIYRIEHENGYGLFWATDFKMSETQRTNICGLYNRLNKSFTRANIKPPYHDDKLNQKHHSHYFFAFLSLKKLKTCLDDCIKLLYENGFKVYSIQIYSDAVVKGKAQAMYMKGDVIQKDVIPLEKLLA
jgi:hypothetical protein